MSNHDNDIMTSIIRLRSHHLAFVLLVIMGSSLILPINASAQTNTYTTGMSVTS